MFAWHMKLREKSTRVRFYLIREGREPYRIPDRQYLARFQMGKMRRRPDMMLQYAAHLAKLYRTTGLRDFEIRVEARVGLNGRKRQLMIDPDQDLLVLERSLAPKPWIRALEEPAPPAPGAASGR